MELSNFFAKGPSLAWRVEGSERIWTVVIAALMLLGLLRIEADLARNLLSDGDRWQQGSWLVNNAAGPIRRGVLGSGLIRLSDWTGLPLLWTVGAIQGTLTAFVFSVIVFSIMRFGVTLVFAVLLLWPSGMLFWAIDRTGALRQELIVYAAFALVLLAAQLPDWSTWLRRIGAGGFIFSVFAHEGIIFFLPFFCSTLLISGWSTVPRRTLWNEVGIILVLSLCAILFAVLHPGAADKMAICQPLLDRGLSNKFCTGPIRWVERDLAEATHRAGLVAASRQLLDYSVYYVLSILPFLLLRPVKIAPCQWIAALPLGGFAFAPLFVVALDWGRWISFYVVAMTFVLLTAKVKGIQMAPLRRRQEFAVYMLVVGAFLWTMPHYAGGLRLGLNIDWLLPGSQSGLQVVF